jgi:Predicted transcriptional regulators
MTMGEAVAATGLSEDTIRYYEREGLIPRLERDGGGRRRFTLHDIARLSFLGKLRQTGMSIGEMRVYVALAVAGDHTAAERRSLLEAHAARLRADLEIRMGALAAIEAKIDLYRESERSGAPLCCHPGAISAARAWR